MFLTYDTHTLAGLKHGEIYKPINLRIIKLTFLVLRTASERWKTNCFLKLNICWVLNDSYLKTIVNI